VQHFTIKSIHNKYKGTLEDILRTGSPSILLNIEHFGDGFPPMIFEVQIMIDCLLSLKKTQHHTYEFKRARLTDLLRPIISIVHANGGSRRSITGRHHSSSQSRRPDESELRDLEEASAPLIYSVGQASSAASEPT